MQHLHPTPRHPQHPKHNSTHKTRIKGSMKKYITMLAISLICHVTVAELIPQNFQSVDSLIANVKKDGSGCILYDTNGIIVGVQLPGDCCTDRNLHLLSKIKSIRYLFIGGISISTNGILALAEYPNLTGLGIVC